MPKRLKSICRQSRCSTTHRNPNGYCDAHQHKKTNWAKSNAKKGSTTARGYGHSWEKIKARIKLRDKNLCQPCFRKGRLVEANAVDHIKPKSQGGGDSDTNLECICLPCHKTKTATERLRR